VAHRHAEASLPHGHDQRAWAGAALAAVPHVALFLRLARRKRVWAVGLAIGTLAGAAVVLVATLIVGAGATWS
jgi:hypothetical protein